MLSSLPVGPRRAGAKRWAHCVMVRRSTTELNIEGAHRTVGPWGYLTTILSCCKMKRGSWSNAWKYELVQEISVRKDRVWILTAGIFAWQLNNNTRRGGRFLECSLPACIGWDICIDTVVSWWQGAYSGGPWNHRRRRRHQHLVSEGVPMALDIVVVVHELHQRLHLSQCWHPVVWCVRWMISISPVLAEEASFPRKNRIE